MGRNLFKAIGNEILDLVYPPDIYCICCGKIIDFTRPYRLCDDCMETMKWATGRTCAKCGKPLSDNDPMDICYSCREHAHAFGKGYTCTEYGTAEKSLVFSLKYGSRTDIADTIGEIMYDRMSAEFGAEALRAAFDLLCPVPVHYERKSMRGYNQAALIAEAFAKRAGIPYRGELLVRTRQTGAMKGMNPAERRENVRGVFEVRRGREELIRGADILIVDDIYTTGSTIDEAARTLADAGAGSVDFISFASGADVVKS